MSPLALVILAIVIVVGIGVAAIVVAAVVRQATVPSGGARKLLPYALFLVPIAAVGVAIYYLDHLILTLGALLGLTLVGGALFRVNAHEKKEMFGIRWWNGDVARPPIRMFSMLQNMVALLLVVLLGITGIPVVYESLLSGAWWPILSFALATVFFWQFRQDVPTAGWVGLAGSVSLLLWSGAMFFLGAPLW